MTAGRSRSGPRTRDAERSRRTILAAAEQLFADEGFEAVSLARIGATARLSRQTPAYFFGSKEELHAAVIAELFAAREAALREPWAALGRAGDGDLPARLRDAVAAYLAFLRDRRTFVAIVEREAVGGARRLREAPHRSTAMEDGLRALADRRPIDVDGTLLTVLSLGMFWFAHAETFLAPRGVDPAAPGPFAAQVERIAALAAPLLGLAPTGAPDLPGIDGRRRAR